MRSGTRVQRNGVTNKYKKTNICLQIVGVLQYAV